MPNFTHFFWDFDGTLYDTYDRMVRAVKKGMDEMNIPYEGVDIKALAKHTVRHACRVLAGEDRADELLARFFSHAEDEGPETMRPYPGCEEALRAVVDKGGVNYLYTHRNHTAIDALKHDGLADLFHDFITYEAGFPDKPAPDALQWAMTQHGLDPEDCIMIGDRMIDAQSGQNAGMKGGLFDPEGYYAQHSADYRFERLTDFPENLL